MTLWGWASPQNVYAGSKYLVSIPPAIDADTAQALTADLLDLLNKNTGQLFLLAPASNPLSYMDNLQSGRFTVVFEGPHVLGALSALNLMQPVGIFSQNQSYVVVVSKRDNDIYQLSDLAGKPLCTGGIPDLYSLHLLGQIDNPSREPVLLPVADHRRRIRALINGQCQAATIQTTRYLTLDPADGFDDLRIIHQSSTLPGFGVAIANDLPDDLGANITATLTSGEGRRIARSLAIALTGDDAPLVAMNDDRLETLIKLADLVDIYFNLP